MYSWIYVYTYKKKIRCVIKQATINSYVTVAYNAIKCCYKNMSMPVHMNTLLGVIKATDTWTANTAGRRYNADRVLDYKMDGI